MRLKAQHLLDTLSIHNNASTLVEERWIVQYGSFPARQTSWCPEGLLGRTRWPEIRARPGQPSHYLRTPQLCSLLIYLQVTRYGVNSQVSAFAYDPIQSLLAVGTKDTKFGPGQVYIFGQKRVAVTLKLSRRASILTLQFCADKLVCVDSKNDLSIFDLETTRINGSYAPPGRVTALATDPTLDFALIGLQTGTIVVSTYWID